MFQVNALVRSLCVMVVFMATLGGVAVGADVIVPRDDTPFIVMEGDVVRIPVKGIAGTNVTAKVTGAAKHSVNSVAEVVKGRPLFGPGNQEVEVRPTGKGEVTVEVTIAPPNGPKETKKYSFKIQ